PRAPSQILLVFNSNDPASVRVANYYRDKRHVPAANLCPIPLGLSPGVEESLEWSDFQKVIKSAIRAKLDELGAGSVFYIVLAYRFPWMITSAPFEVDGQKNLGVAGKFDGPMISSQLIDPYDDLDPTTINN